MKDQGAISILSRMIHREGSKKLIWSVVLWIAAGSFLPTSSAFLKDSRSTKVPIRNCHKKTASRKNIVKSGTQLLLLRKQRKCLAVRKKIPIDTLSFGSISTRIDIVGPLLDTEDGRVLGESFVSSNPGHTCGIPVACHQSLAHGILCPETVIKMKTFTSNRAVEAFLDRYHKHGPMSCMELLSDPEILPHLTAAMRNLVWMIRMNRRSENGGSNQNRTPTSESPIGSKTSIWGRFRDNPRCITLSSKSATTCVKLKKEIWWGYSWKVGTPVLACSRLSLL